VPTPVQAQAIPVILQGHDVLAGAQTGTGKTAGFALPLLQRLADQPALGKGRGSVRALVLTPTRELAAQVEQSVRTYGRHMKLRSTTVFGGVGMNAQINALRNGIDVLVATPGRLLDHLQQRTVDLRNVEILVLDEADRMLDMGFIRDIRRILAMLPAQRQNLFFSATFSKEIRELADSFLRSPVEVAVARSGQTAELVAQLVHPVDKDRKRAVLAHLISSGNWQQVLVFTRTKHGASRLAEQLERDGISAEAIHGNKSQNQRTRALADFKSGKARVLVATDIAARGLDIEELPHVVNFELPHVPEDYVHRIGRTGRAGSHGQAISLVSHEENGLLRDIERLLKTSVPRASVQGFEQGAAPPASEAGAREHRPVHGHGRPRGDTPRRPAKPKHAVAHEGPRHGHPRDANRSRGEANGNRPRGESNANRPRGGTNTNRPRGDANTNRPRGEPNGNQPRGEPNGNREQPNRGDVDGNR
jgi:ATP-dependent RNA helicase RhlE